jgi:DNA-binding NarL/FixJ family response regulator
MPPGPGSDVLCTLVLWTFGAARRFSPREEKDERYQISRRRIRLVGTRGLALANAGHRASEVELVRELVRRAGEGQRVISLPPKEAPQITPRQMEVLHLLSSGHSTREIGRKLYLSEATVRNHIRGLLQAFGAHSQLEVLARARESGVIA